MAANAPQAPQQASVSFDQLASKNPARWNSLNADDKRALAAAAYDFKGIKTIGDAAMEMDRQTFINQASQFTLPANNLATDLASVSAGQTFLNEAMNQFSLDTTDLPANYNGLGNAAAGFSGRVLAGGLQDYGAGAAGAALGAGIGSVVPGLGTALGAGIGYGVGQFGSGAAQGYSQAIDRYQDTGRPIGLREQLGAGAEALGYGALNIIPGIGQIDTGVKGLLRAGARNGLVQGVGTGVVDATGQAITDGKVDWQRAGTAAAVGFGGGLAGTAANATIPAAKRYYQGVRKLTQTAKSMMQVQAAPIGLRGLNAMPDANLATSAIIPEGQGAGAYSGDLPSELQYYGVDPNDRPPNGGGDGNPPGGGGDDNGAGGGGRPVEDQNTQMLRESVDVAVDRARSGDYKAIENAQTYIDQQEAAGNKMPEDIKGKVKEAIYGNRKDLERRAQKLYQSKQSPDGIERVQAQTEAFKNLNNVQRRSVVALAQDLDNVAKSHLESIKRQEQERIGKARTEAEYAKLKEKQAAIEKKQEERLKQFEISRDVEELDNIVQDIVSDHKENSKQEAAVSLKKYKQLESLTEKDVAYIKGQVAKIEAANRVAEVKAYRAANKDVPVPKDAPQQLLAVAKDDATQYASLMVKANADKPAIDLLEQLGYKVDLADNGYGHNKSRRVFFGGRAMTVKFEPGDTMGTLASKFAANGNNLESYLAGKMVKLSKDTGVPVHKIAGETLGDAIEAIDNDIIARESQAAVDRLNANAQIDAELEIAQRDQAAGSYYEDVNRAINSIEERLDNAQTPEEIHAAFDHMDEQLDALQPKEQELALKALKGKIDTAYEHSRRHIKIEEAIDKAIADNEIVTLHGTAFEQVGDSVEYKVNGITGGTNKSLGIRTHETIVSKDTYVAMVHGEPKAYLFIKTIDAEGQLRTRYVYDSPLGSRIKSIELTGRKSPYKYQDVNGADVVLGPKGVVAQMEVKTSIETSRLQKTIDTANAIGEAKGNVNLQQLQKLAVALDSHGLNDPKIWEGAAEAMSPENREAVFKEATGGNC